MRTHCCGHIVAHDVSWAAQTGKHLLRTQNVSEQNQKHILCPGHKICVRNKCCARGQTGKHLYRQQRVRNNVSSFARTLSKIQPFENRNVWPSGRCPNTASGWPYLSLLTLTFLKGCISIKTSLINTKLEECFATGGSTVAAYSTLQTRT